MENKINNFYDLKAWEEAHKLALDIYKITSKFPKEEIFGITNQLRRASTSVSANIAEGFARYHFKEKIKFYYQARGSLAEVQNFILLTRDLGYLNVELYKKFEERTNNIRQLIHGLVRSIDNQI